MAFVLESAALNVAARAHANLVVAARGKSVGHSLGKPPALSTDAIQESTFDELTRLTSSSPNDWLKFGIRNFSRPQPLVVTT